MDQIDRARRDNESIQYRGPSTMPATVPLIPIRSVVLTAPLRAGIDCAPSALPITGRDLIFRAKSGRWQLSVQLNDSSSGAERTELVHSRFFQCVIGDFEEANAAGPAAPHANSTVITVDLERSVATISTSLTGLPPLFALREHQQTHFSSPFIPEAARGSLTPDVNGIADTLRWGHPIDGRTLFAELSVIPSASTIMVDEHGRVSNALRIEDLSFDDIHSLTRKELIEEQLCAFDRSAGRIRSERAFVSLSGGLDSRTLLVGLIKHGRSIPCVTMTGPALNLDDRLAKAFCAAHGLKHETVTLGDGFLRSLPELALDAAELTGGTSCLSQTADLYLYAALGRAYAARISGNLGNQVGRGGVESLSAYSPTPEVFSPPVREHLTVRAKAPWFIERFAARDYGDVLFGEELPYGSIPNYVVGSSQALQLTPYADRRLLQLSRAALARNTDLRQPTVRMLRARDLRHRFAGTRKSLSFQRQFLMKHDLKGRDVPINWGWYASGGWSPKWVLSAATSAADAALIKLSRSPTPAGAVAKRTLQRVRHPSTLVDWPSVLKQELRTLALDTFDSQAVRNSGIFDNEALNTVLRNHFAGGADNHHTIFRCLEISLGLFARSSRH
jgi:hypothetical protein